MKTIILSMLFALASFISFAQNTDSVQYYELEPTELTHKIGEIEYEVLNYFAPKARLNFNVFFGSFLICCDEPKANNYGVHIKTKKEDNHLYIKNAIFQAGQHDTANLHFAKYFAIVEDKDGKITEHPLDIKSSNWVKYVMQDALIGKERTQIPSILVQVEFTTSEIKYNKTDKVYFFRKDPPPFDGSSTLVLDRKDKKDTYYINNGVIEKVFVPFGTKNFKHVAWQVRVQYRAYHKVEN